MYITTVLGYWILCWLGYSINQYICYFFSDFLKPAEVEHWINLYKNLSVFILYMLIANHFLRTRDIERLDPRPWLTGFLWVLCTVCLDMFIWTQVYETSINHIMYKLSFWEGRFYGLNLLGLLFAPVIMDWLLRKFPNNVIIRKIF